MLMGEASIGGASIASSLASSMLGEKSEKKSSRINRRAKIAELSHKNDFMTFGRECQQK
jgi:hypothetical protein